MELAQKPERLAYRRVPCLLDLERRQPKEGAVVVVIRAADASEVRDRLGRGRLGSASSRLPEALLGSCQSEGGQRPVSHAGKEGRMCIMLETDLG
jgi:hypothetical protein